MYLQLPFCGLFEFSKVFSRSYWGEIADGSAVDTSGEGGSSGKQGSTDIFTSKRNEGAPPVGAPSSVQAGLIRLRELSPVDRDSDLLPV